MYRDYFPSHWNISQFCHVVHCSIYLQANIPILCVPVHTLECILSDSPLLFVNGSLAS